MGQYFLIVNPAKRQFLDPSSFGMNPKRSGMMQGAREEFEDITPQAIAMLADFGYADELAEFALEHRYPLRYLGPVVFAVKCEPLKKALDRLDPDWGKKYKEVCE